MSDADDNDSEDNSSLIDVLSNLTVYRHIHCIPVGGKEPLHMGSRGCWCSPLEKPDAPKVWVHNAKDLRDVYERKFNETASDNQQWVLVLEIEISP